MDHFKSITEVCRHLRRNQTPAESKLWKKLRGRRLGDIKFTRQFPIQYFNENGRKHFFIVDFHCHDVKLIIELDGKIHLNQVWYDETRDEMLRQMGYTVLRFSNGKVFSSMEWVLEMISKKHLELKNQ